MAGQDRRLLDPTRRAGVHAGGCTVQGGRQTCVQACPQRPDARSLSAGHRALLEPAKHRRTARQTSAGHSGEAWVPIVRVRAAACAGSEGIVQTAVKIFRSSFSEWAPLPASFTTPRKTHPTTYTPAHGPRRPSEQPRSLMAPGACTHHWLAARAPLPSHYPCACAFRRDALDGQRA